MAGSLDVADVSNIRKKTVNAAAYEIGKPRLLRDWLSPAIKLAETAGTYEAGEEADPSVYQRPVYPPNFNVQKGSRTPLLDFADVRRFLVTVRIVAGPFFRLGLPESSWRNKTPYHNPRAKFLARGLRWPELQNFDSETERHLIQSKSRKRQKFLFGTPPTWSFMIANFALIGYLVINPKFPWSRDF